MPPQRCDVQWRSIDSASSREESGLHMHRSRPTVEAQRPARLGPVRRTCLRSPSAPSGRSRTRPGPLVPGPVTLRIRPRAPAPSPGGSSLCPEAPSVGSRYTRSPGIPTSVYAKGYTGVPGAPGPRAYPGIIILVSRVDPVSDIFGSRVHPGSGKSRAYPGPGPGPDLKTVPAGRQHYPSQPTQAGRRHQRQPAFCYLS